ncbi:hypothetical protein GC163_04010 [bacterium]|nr:hypothetical protein [bacterium]
MVRHWLRALRSRGLSQFRARRERRQPRPLQVPALTQAYEPRLLLSASPVGSEFQVNTFTTSAQSLYIESSQSIATDADGNFVVTWASFAQDGNGYGIFAQRYDAAGVAQGSEFQVNTYTTGTQIYSAVAMDADGDFVITWSSNGQDGSGDGIFAQRYNAAGVAQGTEFQVNTFTTGTQISPSVAMDAGGDFVITWRSSGQDGSAYGIFAQRYDAAGVAQGSEFQVNTYTTGSQTFAAVAMDADGDFVISWHSNGVDGNGSGIVAQRYNAAGVAQGGEFLVNSYTTSNQFFSSVAMDADGDFVVTWMSYSQEGINSRYGIYAQRYNAAGVAQGSEFLVNTLTTSYEVYPRVAMDADGDFVITWMGYDQDGSAYGIFAQQYTAAGVADGGEFQVNTYTTSTQSYPSVAMDADGDFVIAWMSYQQDGSSYGIFAQRYGSADNTAPTVTDVLVNGQSLDANGQLLTSPATMTVVFSEDLETMGAGSVTDTSNWSIFRNGVEQPGRIDNISFGLNMATGNYEALLTFATEPLAVGTYQLIAKETITDLAGNMLDGDDNSTAGGDFSLQFRVVDMVPTGNDFQVNTYTTDRQTFDVSTQPNIAMDADGNYVIAWASYEQDGSAYGIYAQRFNAQGLAQGAEFRVNTTTTNTQNHASVAMDADGDFVIAWSSFGQDGSGYGVYAQRYNALGVAQGTEFLVNTTTTGTQRFPAVAMDADGDYVITWISDQDSFSYGVYAQRYDSSGVAQGSEFRVNTFTTGSQAESSVAMNADGDFVVTWTNYAAQDGSGSGVYAQRYDATGAAQGSEFRVNSFTTDTQRHSRIAMDDAGDFVISWQSVNQDGSAYGSYAQRYDATGAAVGSEFLVNTTTVGNQFIPAIAMDADGDFIVTWSDYYHDGSGYGVYAQRFDNTGTAVGGEFLVNTFTTNYQWFSSVAMNDEGDFAVTWTSFGQDGSNYGIFNRLYRGNVTPYFETLMPVSIVEHLGNGSSVATVAAIDADPNDTLTYSITGGNVGNAFAINSATGEITVNNSVPIDFETLGTFNLRIAATDSANYTRKTTLTINLTDKPEKPAVVPQTFSVPENATNGTTVGTVVASDEDAGDSVTYSITGGNIGRVFAINSTTGAITVANAAALDYETLSTYSLTVQVTDMGGLYRKAVMTINVLDISGKPNISPQMFTIPENRPNGSVVGTVVATPLDRSDTLTYSLTGGNTNQAFAINSSTGQITVNNINALDFETNPTFNVTVQVMNQNSDFRKAVMTINLTDIGGKPYVSPQTFTVAENSPSGTVVGDVVASSPDIGDTLTYSITGGNVGSAFRINANNGLISVNRAAALDFETRPTFNVTVQVMNQQGLFRKAVITINLTDVSELNAGLFSSMPSLLSFTL